MRNEDRKKLLADYAVALVAERDLWERLHQSHLTESERCRTLGEWKQVAASLKRLVRQLRDAPAVEVQVQVLVPVQADVFRRRFPVPSLVGTLRRVALWRTRLEAAIPSLDAP